MTAGSAVRSGPAPMESTWPVPLLLAAVYLGLALLSVTMSRHSGGVATLWFANAVAVAVLATTSATRTWRRPACLLAVGGANLLANLLAGDGWLRSAVFVGPNLLEVLTGAWLLRGGRAWSFIDQGPWHFLNLLGRGAVLPALVGAGAGAAWMHLSLGSAWLEVGLDWFEGSLIGAVSTLPLALRLLTMPPGQARRCLWSLEHLGVQTLTAGATLLAVAWLPMPFIYTALPLLAAAALADFVILAAASFTVTLVVGLAMAWGVFVLPPISERWEELFLYMPLVISLLPVMMLGVTFEGLRQGRAELQLSIAQLARAHEGLSEFVRIASHDLREPLNTVDSYSALAEAQAANLPGLRAQLGQVRRATQRMRAQLDDLLTYAQLGREQSEPEVAVNLGLVLDEVLARLDGRIRASGAEVSCGPDWPVVPGRPKQLALLLSNLLANALKFVPAGQKPRVRLDAVREPGRVVLTVADQGIGIAEADIPRLFGLFRRLHPQRLYDGTGLGLALCQRVVELHRGEIWIRSMPGQGTQVHVALPLQVAPAPAGRADAAARRSSGEEDWHD
jgi:signal transduction histidine kinase